MQSPPILQHPRQSATMQQSIAYFLGKPGRVSTRDGFEICSSTDRKAILFLPYSEAVVAPGYNTERKKSYRYLIRTNGSMPGQAQSNPLQDCQNSRNQSLTIPPVEYSGHLYAQLATYSSNLSNEPPHPWVMPLLPLMNVATSSGVALP